MFTMSEEEADRYRIEAEECRRLAEQAIEHQDKEAWLRLAADWLRLAEGADSRHELRTRKEL
jgi:site-specific recombinase